MRNAATWARLSLAALVLGMPDTLPAATYNVPNPASLSLTSMVGGARLTYRGATNFRFLVQSSTDWTSWSLVASNVATNRTMAVRDNSAGSFPERYYRAVTLKTSLFYQGTFSGGEAGNFVLFARTNNQVTFLGVNTTRARAEFLTPLTVNTNGTGCGTYIAGAPGCVSLTATSTVSGRFTNAASQAGTLTGGQKANYGIFSQYAGYYTGTFSGFCPGTARALFCPDGTLAIYFVDSNTQRTDGQVAVILANNLLDFYLVSGAGHVLGTFAPSTRTFSGTIHENPGCSPLTFSLTRSEPLF
jgi:hypothetical protein